MTSPEPVDRTAALTESLDLLNAAALALGPLLHVELAAGRPPEEWADLQGVLHGIRTTIGLVHGMLGLDGV